MNLLKVHHTWFVTCGADAEQQKLQGEIDAAMASLDALTAQAGDVVQQQEQLAELQQQQQLLLQEALAKKVEKEQEVFGMLLQGSCCQRSSWSHS
jgi:phenylpropionate dioxygenase-like ring-hydroxylating dioxygenase large terminal subunit